MTSLIGYRILGWKPSSSGILKTSISSLAIEKSKAFLCLDPLYESCNFSLKDWKIFSLRQMVWNVMMMGHFKIGAVFIPSAGCSVYLSVWNIMFTSGEFSFNYFINSFPLSNFSDLLLWKDYYSDVGSGLILVFPYFLPPVFHPFVNFSIFWEISSTLSSYP